MKKQKKDATFMKKDLNSIKDTETQTYNSESSIYSTSLRFLLELAQMKTRQDQMEVCVKALKEQLKIQEKQSKTETKPIQGAPTR